MALGSSRLGWARSFAVNVTMPNPRNEKNVSATADMMSLNGGYPDGASRCGWMLASVTTENTTRMPMTMITTTDYVRATTWDPMTFSTVMTSRTSTAKTFAQALLSFVKIALA